MLDSQARLPVDLVGGPVEIVANPAANCQGLFEGKSETMSRASQRWTKVAAAKSFACAALCAVLAGCSSGPSLDATQALNPDPPAKMFADGDALMTAGKFDAAAEKFEAVDREHPYAPEARRAMVMAAYAYYRAGKTPEAIATAERYVSLHPGTKEGPLAHHIIAAA